MTYATRLVEAARMLHPDLSKLMRRLKDYPELRKRVAAYRKAWAEHDDSYAAGQRCKAAERAVNNEVEHITCGLVGGHRIDV